ncbi:hypothetical protein HF521_021582 [Silurus meridionalis]|uniref:Uncharacterized protein n=1 Tax=Silurus meridionalis TaxID=175797 RepID=A0A8T0BGF1_SILME|nr:hypothetical protein HF521_021582 [Silurus meridionalis]
MSSRRKRAAPVRMDEADKNKLNWNMHEHRRTEGDFEDLEAFPEPSVSSLTDHVPIVSNAELLSHSSSLPAEKEEEPGCSVQDSSPDTTELNVPSVSTLDPGWKALIGEFELYPKVPLELADNTFCLQQTGDAITKISYYKLRGAHKLSCCVLIQWIITGGLGLAAEKEGYTALSFVWRRISKAKAIPFGVWFGTTGVPQ